MTNGCSTIVNKATVHMSSHQGGDTSGIDCAYLLPLQMSDPMRNTQKHQHEHH